MSHLEIASTVDRVDWHRQSPGGFHGSWSEIIFHYLATSTSAMAVQDRFVAYHVTIVRGELVVVAGWGIALRWDQTPDDPSDGCDDALMRWFSTDDLATYDTLSVTAIAVYRDFSRMRLVVDGDHRVASTRPRRGTGAGYRPGATHPEAHVSPHTHGELRALATRWRRPPRPVDPHARRGTRILALAPRGMVVTGTLSQWEA